MITFATHMKIRKCIKEILIMSILLLTLFVYSSENKEVDDLLLKLSQTKEDTSKVKLLLKLSDKTSWSDIKSSEKYAKQALDLSQHINFKKGMAYAYFKLARVFSDYELDLSENLVLQSLKQAKEIDDSILMARVYNVLGNLKSNLNHNEDALFYYNQSLDIYLRHNEDSSAAAIYSNLGILLAVMHGDSLSISYYKKAAEINKKTKNYLWLAINYMNMGYDLMDFGNLQEGFNHLQNSLQIAEEHNFNRLYPWIYNNYSYYYSKIGNQQETIIYANKALQAARANDNRLQELDALTNLKEAYIKLSDINSAYQYLEQIKTVSDSINKHNRLKEIDLLEMRYKYEEERKEQELETALLEASYYKKELIYVLILLGSGIVIVTFISLYLGQRNRNKRKGLEQKTTLLEKEKLANELEFKNKELTTNVMYLLKKNEFISNISEKLKNTNLELNEDSSNVLDKIISELDKSISNDNWEDFEMRFQEVHVGFYNNLSKKFPSLTPNELRLCAFLRLNMTSKEIADITFQSMDSLKIARYRLRKKLELDREDNLITFLTKL